jgi:hypothetical protein
MRSRGNYEITKMKLAQYGRILKRTNMNAPRYIAIFVCVLLAFTLLQGLTWPLRPAPDWQPLWWQSPILAGIGHLLRLPGMIPALILENCGIFNHGILLSAIAFGLLVELSFISIVVYFIASRWVESRND